MDTLQDPFTIPVDPDLIEGFDIPIEADDAKRIAELVNHYEATIIAHVDEEYVRATTRADRVADKMAAFGGSWTFIGLFGVTLTLWIGWNTLAFTQALHFDPQPYILLNLCLSFVAAFQAPVIMMSQNRQAARDKREAIIDFAINYKAGMEIDDMQGHLHRIEDKLQRMERLLEASLAQRQA